MAFCPNCGARIMENAKFCTECGTKIEAPKPPQPAPPPQPVYEAPAAVPPQPVYEAPAAVPPQPVYEAPAEPTQPVYEAPAAPPVQPARETPAEPAVQPAYKAPSQPAYHTQQPAAAASVPSGGADKAKRPVNKKLFLIGGIALAVIVILAVVLIAVLGGGNVDEDVLGKYVCVSCTVDGADKAAGGEWVELQAKGKATVYIFGKEYSGKWSLKGEDFTLSQGGDKYEGSLKNGVLTLDFSGQVYTYEKEGKSSVPAGPAQSEKPEEKTSEAGYWVLHHTEGAEALSPEDVKDFAGLGINIYVVLNEDGSGVFCMDEPVNVKWAKGKISADGETIAYSFKDDTFSFELEGTTYFFSRGKGQPPMTQAPETTPDLPDEGSGPYEWWEGEWYGWWIVESGYGAYASWEDYFWDAYARIEAYDDDTGHFTLWDVDTDADSPLADMNVSFGDGVTEHGAMINEDGYFMDYEMEHADFVCDPGAMGFEIEDMILVEFRYYDPTNEDDYMDVYIFLRPWGRDWYDLDGKTNADWPYDDMMPMYYKEWYMPLVAGGHSLPDSYNEGLELLGGTEKPAETTAPTSTPAPGGTPSSGLTSTPPGTGDILAEAQWENCGVEVVGAEYFVDASGKDAIRIFFNFFNCGQDSTCAAETLSWTVSQNGSELWSTYPEYGDYPPEYGNDWLYIRPAIKIGCCLEYAFDAAAGKIDVQFVNYWGNGETLNISFDPYKLPGRPPELELMPITWPVWIINAAQSGTVPADFSVNITSAELVSGYYGDCIRFYVDVTNLSAEEQSVFWASTMRAYQDGVELPVTYNVASVPEDDLVYEELAPGDSITVSFCYELRSENPVEFEVRDFWGNLVAGVINYLN